jgi:hypothetical protein
MGAYPISLLSVPTLGYLAAILTGNWAKGLVFGLLIHVIWVEIWNNGASFVPPPGVLPPGSPPLGDLLVFYFWATMLFSIVGAVMFWMFGWHPLLDGLTMMSRKADGSTDYGRTGKRIAKVLLVLLIFFGSHVVFELHTEDFPAPWGGIVCTVGCIVGWIVFFLLLRGEYRGRNNPNGIFVKNGSDKVHTTATTFMQNELSVFILFASLGHLIYITAYWAWEFAFNDIAMFITSLWYFYASLIISGSILIVMALVGYFLVKRPESKRAGMTPGEETPEEQEPSTPLMPPLPPPVIEPTVPGQSGYRVGTYKPQW